MSPAGSELKQWACDEGAQVHARVREREARGGEDELVDGYDVDVDGAVAVGTVGVAVRCGSGVALGLLYGVEEAVQ